MGRKAKFPYYADHNVQVVSLPFKDYKMQMIIILPVEMFGLKHLESSLTGEKLLNYINKLNGSEDIMVCSIIFYFIIEIKKKVQQFFT